jgi:hypothetical protein
MLDFCPEKSVTKYQSTMYNIPEERRPHVHSGKRLKWRRLTELKADMIMSDCNRKYKNAVYMPQVPSCVNGNLVKT